MTAQSLAGRSRWTARPLRGGVQVVSIEANCRHARIAQAICRFAGVDDHVYIMVEESGAIIPTPAGPFHLVIMDHNKDEYLVDLWRIEDRDLVEPGWSCAASAVGSGSRSASSCC